MAVIIGTPQTLADANGEVVWQARYRSYGAVAEFDTNEVENNVRFQGQYFDKETGLHYNRFRYYHPGTGRFVNQDPMGLLGGDNLYRYAPNATGWIDPLGLTAAKKVPPERPILLRSQRDQTVIGIITVGVIGGVSMRLFQSLTEGRRFIESMVVTLAPGVLRGHR